MTGGTDGFDWTAARNVLCAAFLSVGVAGCASESDPAVTLSPPSLRIGFGLTTGANAQAGIRQATLNIVLESLISFGVNGRPQSRLAESWELDPYGERLRIRLRPNVLFHDGSPVTAQAVRDFLASSLPGYLGDSYRDVVALSATSELDLELRLRARSSFVMEGLDILVASPSNPSVGTGPFKLRDTAGDRVELEANAHYYLGKPYIEEITFEPYSSIRAAWADLLRQRVDMLYEVGVDAIDLLEPSQDVNIYTAPRPYALVVMLNVKTPFLRDAAVRRKLNAAIDRDSLLTDALQGYGVPAESPLWPYHWAHQMSSATFEYAPSLLNLAEGETHFTLLYTEPSHERLALAIQRQLQAVGVRMNLETAPLDDALRRAEAGEFDAFLADAALGPTLIRPYWFWYTGGRFNWGRFSSDVVDSALDRVRASTSERDYIAAVASLQSAIVDDPPAIFLAWGQRSRAVSRRFAVPAEPNRDILPGTLRLWRLAEGGNSAPHN
jgi:peptide/nickel transport system substrate-binding protein